MSDWQERLRPTIKFTSPEGNVFEALWRSNSAPQEKNIGEFNYPKVLGTVTQDLGVKSTRYPMIIYFDGPDNDIESQRFKAALNEYGAWSVIHPELGEKILQPISFSPNIDPTGSGNITAITTEWIEPISDAVIASVQELEARIQEQQDKLNSQGANQYDENVSQENPGETIAITDESNNILDSYDEFLEGLSELNSEIYNETVGIKRGIEAAIIQPIINTASIAGQFQQLLQLPGLVINNFEARIGPYVDFVNGLIEGSESVAANSVEKNKVSTREMALTAAIGTMGTLAITSDFQTKTQAIQAIEDITGIFNTITNSLDESQSIFSENTIDNQFFSQSQSFSESALLIGYISAYLLRIAFDLKIEKRFILKQNRAPIEITITEYGDLGENDSNLDLFISSNDLKGNDILVIPSGREVVVYV